MAATSAQLLTVEQWMDLSEGQTRRTELVDGEIVQMGNARAIHEKLKAIWIEFLMEYLFRNRIGRLYSETMYRLSPGLARIPDVSVLLPDRPAPEGAFEGAPEVAIEIVSSETAAEMERKLRDYLGHGSKLVVYVYPDDQTLWAFRPEGKGTGQRYSIGDTFEATDLLPGFSLRVDSLFEDARR